MRNGKFITFEGCDGCGKSTQLKLLCNYLEKTGIPFTFTREPGGGKISEQIRSIILDGKNSEMTDECEALLYASARVQHLFDTVAPALERGDIVICDRYVDSSFAYQAHGRGLGEKFVREINAYAIENYLPDLTVFIDLTPTDAFERKHGADQNDRIEQAGLDFHNRVYEGFVKCAENEPERFVRIDGKKSIEGIFDDVLSALKQKGIL